MYMLLYNLQPIKNKLRNNCQEYLLLDAIKFLFSISIHFLFQENFKSIEFDNLFHPENNGKQ